MPMASALLAGGTGVTDDSGWRAKPGTIGRPAALETMPMPQVPAAIAATSSGSRSKGGSARFPIQPRTMRSAVSRPCLGALVNMTYLYATDRELRKELEERAKSDTDRFVLNLARHATEDSAHLAADASHQMRSAVSRPCLSISLAMTARFSGRPDRVRHTRPDSAWSARYS